MNFNYIKILKKSVDKSMSKENKNILQSCKKEKIKFPDVDNDPTDFINNNTQINKYRENQKILNNNNNYKIQIQEIQGITNKFPIPKNFIAEEKAKEKENENKTNLILEENNQNNKIPENFKISKNPFSGINYIFIYIYIFYFLILFYYKVF
jgi:hypothetical protein